MKLLNEDCIAESKTGYDEEKKYMYIEGPFLQATAKNRNGRIYSEKLIRKICGDFQPLIESHEALGELNHPESGQINPKEAAILITSLKMDGQLAIGKAKVLTTPNGKILESLINDGVRMGVSSRGTGDLEDDGITVNESSYHLITIDAVYMPSAQTAYVDPMYESVQYATKWVLNEATGLYHEQKVKVEEAAKTFNKTVDNLGSKAIKEAFIEFTKSLRG